MQLLAARLKPVAAVAAGRLAALLVGAPEPAAAGALPITVSARRSYTLPAPRHEGALTGDWNASPEPCALIAPGYEGVDLRTPQLRPASRAPRHSRTHVLGVSKLGLNRLV